MHYVTNDLSFGFDGDEINVVCSFINLIFDIENRLNCYIISLKIYVNQNNMRIFYN